MKNMGLTRLHLVRPDDFDAYRIEGVAHTGLEIIESARRFDDLSGAVSGCRQVLGTTARGRRARRTYLRPRDAAAEAMELARVGGDVAVVFGREDRGLSNAELDLCNRVVTIPTHPEHSSLNLAQAVAVIAYEIFLASGMPLPFKKPKRQAPPASADQLDDLCWEIEETLHAVDFFKSEKVVPVMRTVREVAGRARLDGREVALFRAMAKEARNYLSRLRSTL